MGATSWRYFTPYTPNANDALERLRQETFAAGDYKKPVSGWREQFEEVLRIASDPNVANASPDLLQIVEQTKHLIKICSAYESGSHEGLTEAEKGEVEQLRLAVQQSADARAKRLSWHSGTLASMFKKKRPPKTIAGLLRQAAQAGTHSIIDIKRIGEHLGFGVASPLTREKLLAAFGTDRPTREQVTQTELSFWEELDRWQAVYFVIYQDGEPVEYAFVGCSGD